MKFIKIILAILLISGAQAQGPLTGSSLRVSGTSILSGPLTFNTTTNAGLQLNNLTTTQRNALTPSFGQIIANSTASQIQWFDGSAWTGLGSGGGLTGSEGGYDSTDSGKAAVFAVDGSLSATNYFTIYDGVGHTNYILLDATSATGERTISLPDASGKLTISATGSFGTDNRLLRSDGTITGIQSSGITLSDTDDLTGVSSIAATAGAFTSIRLARTNLSGGTVLTVGNHYWDTLSAIRTLTFSGTPTDGDEISLQLTVTGGPHILTIPASYRTGSVGSDTTVSLITGNHLLRWVRISSTWVLTDSSVDVEEPYTIYGNFSGGNLAPSFSSTGVLDFGPWSTFELPNSASPTVNVFGQIAGDNNLWAAGRGALIHYDGTAATALIGVLVSDPPSTGEIPIWNSGGFITWETLPDSILPTELDTSAELDALVADNTGTGALVLNTQPEFVTDISVGNGTTGSGIIKILEDIDDGTNFASFQVPALAANTVYTLPSTDGNNGDVLSSNGSGVLSWIAPSAASFDSTTVNATTWSNGANASNTWTFDVSGTDHTMTAGNGVMTFSHGVTVSGTTTLGTLSGALDAGSATSLEIPNGTDPDITVEGQVSYETDIDQLRGHDGTVQFSLARKIEDIQVTVVSPNDLADSERDAFWIWENVSGMNFVITGWSFKSDTDDTTLNIEEIDGDGANNSTVDAVEIATNGTGLFYASDTTITAGTIETGHVLVLDFDDTDIPGQVKGVIYGYFSPP